MCCVAIGLLALMESYFSRSLCAPVSPLRSVRGLFALIFGLSFC